MDNYLRVSNKLYNLRRFLEGSQGDMFERKFYLALLKVEDELAITQCQNCGEYNFVGELEPRPNNDGGVDLHCVYCTLD